MKVFIICSLLALITSPSNAQKIRPAPPDKSVVYFMRPANHALLLTTRLYDGDKFIGRIKGLQYFRYACEPGDHLFWADRDTKAMVKAKLDSGRVYLILVKPRHLVSGVLLTPVDPREMKLKKFRKLVREWDPRVFEQSKLDQLNQRYSRYIEQSMKRFTKWIRKGYPIALLTGDMFIDPRSLESSSAE